jgi:SulP family sulfate permease
MLAGLPPEMGLYASIIPLILYAIFGTSKTLAVGPVAVIALMTSASCSQFADPGSSEYILFAIILALLSGIILAFMGLLKLGFIANFLSHPVISGFITASGLIIASSQLNHILGIEGSGSNLYEILVNLAGNLININGYTVSLGVFALIILFWCKTRLRNFLLYRGLKPFIADILSRTGPVFAVLLTSLAVWLLDLEIKQVAIVGSIPKGLPTFAMPSFTFSIWIELLPAAILISLVGYVETVSVAQTLASKRRQRIDPNQELIALGISNVGSGISGGFPVTGGFARSVVNFDAGAKTPAAGAFTAIGIAFATMFLTPVLFYLPKATLSATIIIAVLSLVDFKAVFKTFSYSSPDGMAMTGTILATLLLGVEVGIISGVGISLLMYLYRTSRPHIARIGQVPGTQHFRNVNRHLVITSKKIISLRIDESLYFPNARYLEDSVNSYVGKEPEITDVILMFSAINYLDASALESLEAINRRLADAKVNLHLSEVKGPVMDQLKRTHFLSELSGQVFLSQFDAFKYLEPELAERTLNSNKIW